MAEKPKTKVVYVRESNFQSYVADAFTFASICAAYWINYKFIGGNDALDILLLICFFMFALGRVSDFKRHVEQAQKDAK